MCHSSHKGPPRFRERSTGPQLSVEDVPKSQCSESMWYACGKHDKIGPFLINTIHHTSETQHVQNPNHLFCPPNMLSLCFFTAVNTIIPKLLEPETWELH